MAAWWSKVQSQIIQVRELANLGSQKERQTFPVSYFPRDSHSLVDVPQKTLQVLSSRPSCCRHGLGLFTYPPVVAIGAVHDHTTDQLPGASGLPFLLDDILGYFVHVEE